MTPRDWQHNEAERKRAENIRKKRVSKLEKRLNEFHAKIRRAEAEIDNMPKSKRLQTADQQNKIKSLNGELSVWRQQCRSILNELDKID